MAFLAHVLDPPRYGYLKNGQFYRPTQSEILREFFARLNPSASKRNWLSFFTWTTTLSLSIPLFFFIFHFFSLSLFIIGFVYSMIVMGSHGTFWLHRYCTHRSFKFKYSIVRFLLRNLVIKIIPEETYVVSHHVHHSCSDTPGDPYNPYGGWLYCFLADVNHQRISQTLSEKEYGQTCQLLKHTGVHLNSYDQYKTWGSLCHPFWTIIHYLLNWLFWYGIFYFLGGHALATTLFASAGVWAIGVRTFNYEGHARGKQRQREGVDFYHKDLSINQTWPGFVAGEWHNNHHLFPRSARSGFLSHQLDLPWLLVCLLKKLKLVLSVHDHRKEFFEQFYLPYLEKKIKRTENTCA